jgi:hypothetical protein
MCKFFTTFVNLFKCKYLCIIYHRDLEKSSEKLIFCYVMLFLFHGTAILVLIMVVCAKSAILHII